MKDILKVIKYQLQDFKKPIIIFYIVITSLTLFMLLINVFDDNTLSMDGFGLIGMIFLFVTGINSFKSEFKFMSAFNVSRKRFLLASILTFMVVSLLMAIIDAILNQTLIHVFPYEGYYESIYKNQYFFKDLTWTFSLYFFTLNVGFFIGVLYYVCSKLVKIILFFFPTVIIILWAIINQLTDGKLINYTIKVFNFMAGLTTNSYMAVLSLLIGSLLFSGINYIFIRKIVIKD